MELQHCDKTAERPTLEFDTVEERARRAARTHKNSLRIICWNADLVKLKFKELYHRVKKMDIEVVPRHESKLRDKDKTPKLSIYICVRLDRPRFRAVDGFLSYVKEDVVYD